LLNYFFYYENDNRYNKPLQTKFSKIILQLSCPYTPEQNSFIERKHRHVVKLGLASMYHSSIPLEHWDTVFESTLFVINRLSVFSHHWLCHHLRNYLDVHLTINIFTPLVVNATLYSYHIININCSLGQKHVSSWDIQPLIKGINVFIYLQIRCISPEMCIPMSNNFPLPILPFLHLYHNLPLSHFHLPFYSHLLSCLPVLHLLHHNTIILQQHIHMYLVTL
jgi:hypothetical protein